jgi:putative ABC transport system permease protein
LGATKHEATRYIRNKAIKIAMTPSLNSMASMGLVSIPGMMTGQILAGNTPEEAAFTQIILMLLITVGTYSGTYIALNLARSRKFTQDGIPCFG